MNGADYDVVVVGAGPAGLLMAAELARHGVETAILERRDRHGAGTRAIGVHGPTLAALEPSGATERILAGATRITRGIARARRRELGEVRLGRRHARFPFVASAPQPVTESAVSAGAPEPELSTEVRAMSVLPDRVVLGARRADHEVELRARAVVLASGAGGRELALSFSGVRTRLYPDRYLMTDLARVDEQPSDAAIITLDRAGVVESFPLPGGGRRLVAWDGAARSNSVDTAERRAERLRRAVGGRTGDWHLAARIQGADSFGIRRALLRRMRSGRVFAIGDAAHEISPIGGQGMNLGLLDAAFLAPALARWLREEDHTAELERWEADRLAAARTAARIAGASTALGRGNDGAAHATVPALAGVVLASPLRTLVARAYTMGLDRGA